jgi:hypothetical protein
MNRAAFEFGQAACELSDPVAKRLALNGPSFVTYRQAP